MEVRIMSSKSGYFNMVLFFSQKGKWNSDFKIHIFFSDTKF